MLGAERVIAIDRFPYRLRMAQEAGAEIINYEEVDDVVQTLKDLTANIGPDACMDAVGMEAYGHSFPFLLDQAKQKLKLTTDRANVLRQCIQACRKGGTVSVPGVYGGLVDKIPMGAFMNKALSMKTGQTHMMRFMKPLLDRIQNGDIDPSFVISHRVPIDQAPKMYQVFRDKQENCTKVVLDPWADGAAAA
jgi:threonine dehydrogenase-like Zn-dependent dehydrogenase